MRVETGLADAVFVLTDCGGWTVVREELGCLDEIKVRGDMGI